MSWRNIGLNILTSLTVIITASIPSLSADRPQQPLNNRVSYPARMSPVFLIPEMEIQGEFAPAAKTDKITLNSSRIQSNPDTVGYTTFDVQHYFSMARQVEHRGHGYIHFDWTAQTLDLYGGDRGIGYQAYSDNDCSYAMESGGIRVETAYAGFVGIDADPGGCAVLSAYHNVSNIYYPMAYWDYLSGGPAFGVFTPDGPDDIYGWSGSAENTYNIWPVIEWQIGTETVLHMVATETYASQPFQTISYYRRVGPYGSGQGVWTDQRVIDSGVISCPVVTSSPVSDKVAIVWTAPPDYKRDQPDEFENNYENDIWYAVSANQGADWAADTVSSNLGAPSIGHLVDVGICQGNNITRYDPDYDAYRAYGSLSALISTEDELHIAWVCRQWLGKDQICRRNGAIFHWAENTPMIIRAVVRADWDTGGACYGYPYGTDVDKPVISECDGKFYVLFTQFGRPDNPCGDVDLDKNILNGYLYMSTYDPAVTLRWDVPQRITSVPQTPNGCQPGDMNGPGACNSEYWASMARFGRVDNCLNGGQSVLDILYINDYAPGICVIDSGTWTVNPVMWVTAPCREVVGEIGYGDDAGDGLGICYGDLPIFARPDGIDSFQVTLINMGTLENAFSVEVFVDSSNSPTNGANTSLTVAPASGVIPPVGEYYGWGSQTITITITTADEADMSTVYGHILVTHQAPNSPRIIPFCLTIYYHPWPEDYFILETACKKLKIYTDGQMSNDSPNQALDYTDDPDDCADLYLYDGSPVICREIEGEKRCFFSVYGNAYSSDNALRAVGWINVDSTSSADYTIVASEMITADSTIGLIQEYIVPQSPENCNFIVKRLAFWNRTDETLRDVAMGDFFDWDVPSYESEVANESDYDSSRNMIYQYAMGHDACDSTLMSERFAGIASPMISPPFKNFMSLENDVFVYESGPFGLEAPLPADTIYGLMQNFDGFSLAELDSCEDISTLVTFDVYDLLPHDTVCATYILLTTRDGRIALNDVIDIAEDFLLEHYEIGPCPYHGEWDCIPGDANDDKSINVGDAVYIISYVFKGGQAPQPSPVCSGDANGDCRCDVGDAVYLINYIFRDGSPPPAVDFEQWYSDCY